MNRTAFFYFNKNIYKPIKNISLGVSMNKKAVSPVIAVLLLVVIAVAAAIITYIWLTGYIGTIQQQTTPGTMQEKIKIEAVSYSESDSPTLTVYVRNVGDVNVEIAAGYAYDRSGTAISTSYSIGDSSLSPGEATTVTITLSNTLSDGQTYVVKVVTKKGTEATHQFVYRS